MLDWLLSGGVCNCSFLFFYPTVSLHLSELQALCLDRMNNKRPVLLPSEHRLLRRGEEKVPKQLYITTECDLLEGKEQEPSKNGWPGYLASEHI